MHELDAHQLDRRRLDEHQQVAVESNARFLQIVGYPGTGKTLVLANRIARLIETGTPPQSIVALTFTKSSCLSLRRSISRNLPATQVDEAARVHINTYHSFCQDLIERFPYEVGISPEWQLTDFLDLHNVVHYPTIDYRRRAVHYPQGLTQTQRDRTLRTLRDYKAYDFDQALDYGHRIIKMRELGISHLIIDEFQDCTSMQWDLVRAILQACPGTRLTVAGDPNQEIFNFQPGHLESAFDTMKRECPDTQRLYLRYNYRSTPEIIDAFQAIVGKDTQAPLKLIATTPGGKEPEMLLFASVEDEISGVAELVRQLARGDVGYDYGDIAILLRTNSDVQQFMNFLRGQQIPVQLDLGVRSFGVKRKPSVALTLMKWAHSRKDFYLAQLLHNRYHKFVNNRDFEALAHQPTEVVARPLHDRLLLIDPKKYDHPLLNEHLPSLEVQLVGAQTPGEVADIVIHAVNSWKTLAGARGVHRTPASDSAAWDHMVEEFKQCASNVRMEDLPLEEQRQRGAALLVVLRYMFAGEKPMPVDCGVSVATIHSAKSKEWPVVILPSGSSQSNLWLQSNAAENQRLQYVAASRARKELYFSNAGPIRPPSRNSFVSLSEPKNSVSRKSGAGLSLAAAKMRDPLVFKQIHAVRRLSRVIKL